MSFNRFYQIKRHHFYFCKYGPPCLFECYSYLLWLYKLYNIIWKKVRNCRETGHHLFSLPPNPNLPFSLSWENQILQLFFFFFFKKQESVSFFFAFLLLYCEVYFTLFLLLCFFCTSKVLKLSSLLFLLILV